MLFPKPLALLMQLHKLSYAACKPAEVGSLKESLDAGKRMLNTHCNVAVCVT